MDIKEELDINSEKDLNNMEPFTSLRLSPPTKLEISLTLLSMEPFIKVCPTSTTTAELEESSTSTPEPLESSSTSKSETESFPKEFMSESSTSNYQPQDKDSLTASEKTTRRKHKQTRRKNVFQQKESLPNLLEKSTSQSQTSNF